MKDSPGRAYQVLYWNMSEIQKKLPFLADYRNQSYLLHIWVELIFHDMKNDTVK